MAKKGIYKSDWSKKLSIIAICVAVLSAMIAYLPFHYQYVRKVNDLKVTILNIVPNYKDLMCVADLIFTNNGNQECSITSVILEGENISYDIISPKSVSGSSSVNPIPFTIKPNEVITKQFQNIPGHLKPGLSLFARMGDTIEYRLAFGIVDSKGYYHKVNAPIFIGIIGGGMSIGNKKADFELNKLPISIQLLPSDIEESSMGTWPSRSF